jgi:hypothetical protein
MLWLKSSRVQGAEGGERAAKTPGGIAIGRRSDEAERRGISLQFSLQVLMH